MIYIFCLSRNLRLHTKKNSHTTRLSPEKKVSTAIIFVVSFIHMVIDSLKQVSKLTAVLGKGILVDFNDGVILNILEVLYLGFI